MAYRFCLCKVPRHGSAAWKTLTVNDRSQCFELQLSRPLVEQLRKRPHNAFFQLDITEILCEHFEDHFCCNEFEKRTFLWKKRIYILQMNEDFRTLQFEKASIYNTGTFLRKAVKNLLIKLLSCLSFDVFSFKMPRRTTASCICSKWREVTRVDEMQPETRLCFAYRLGLGKIKPISKEKELQQVCCY